MLFKIKGEKVHLCMVPHIIVINSPFGHLFGQFSSLRDIWEKTKENFDICLHKEIFLQFC